MDSLGRTDEVGVLVLNQMLEECVLIVFLTPALIDIGKIFVTKSGSLLRLKCFVNALLPQNQVSAKGVKILDRIIPKEPLYHRFPNLIALLQVAQDRQSLQITR